MAPPWKVDVPPQEMETNTHYTGNGRLGPALSFTYVIGAVALECGVADDKRTRRNGDGTAVALKTEVQTWMSHRRTYSIGQAEKSNVRHSLRTKQCTPNERPQPRSPVSRARVRIRPRPPETPKVRDLDTAEGKVRWSAEQTRKVRWSASSADTSGEIERRTDCSRSERSMNPSPMIVRIGRYKETKEANE